MNISLTPELEQLVNEKVKTGLYQTASEVIRERLRLLRERDQRVEALRRDVRAGFEAVECGEFTDYDERNIKELADRVKSRGRKRLAEEGLKTGAIDIASAVVDSITDVFPLLARQSRGWPSSRRT